MRCPHNIERAIKRGTGDLDGMIMEELVYEASGQAGQRSSATSDRQSQSLERRGPQDLRSRGGMGGPGSVAYLFDRRACSSCRPGTTEKH